MASVYSGAGEGRYGTVQVKGMVEFGMQYNYKQCALEIHVKQCKELAAVDTKRNRSDPYVKVIVWNDGLSAFDSQVHIASLGLSPARQDEEWKAEDQSEEAHAESNVWWSFEVLHVAQQSRIENSLGHCLAFGHVCKCFLKLSFWMILEMFSWKKNQQKSTNLAFEISKRLEKNQDSPKLSHFNIFLTNSIKIFCGWDGTVLIWCETHRLILHADVSNLTSKSVENSFVNITIVNFELSGPQRLPWRSDDKFAEQGIWQSPTTVVCTRREGKHYRHIIDIKLT